MRSTAAFRLNIFMDASLNHAVVGKKMAMIGLIIKQMVWLSESEY
jgi:hypothetical protein